MAAVMMHVFRPVRTQASRLLATHSGANSTVERSSAEHQQLPYASPDSGAPFVAVQQPNNTGVATPFGFADCSNAVNLPVIWPMHAVFNPSIGQEGQWPEVSAGTAPSGDQSTVVAPQEQPQDSPQMMSFPHSGGFVWMQPVYWPAFRGREGMHCHMQASDAVGCEGIQTSEAVGCEAIQASEAVEASEAVVAEVSDQQHACSDVSVLSGTQPAVMQLQHAAEMQLRPTSGARRQRRSKRGGASRKSPQVVLQPVVEEVGQLGRAAESNEEASQIVLAASEGCSPAKAEDELPTSRRPLPVRWADEEPSPCGAAQQLPVSWSDFQELSLPEAPQQSALCWADATETEFPSEHTRQSPICRKARAAAANSEQSLSCQSAAVTAATDLICESVPTNVGPDQFPEQFPRLMQAIQQVHHNMSSQGTGPADDSLCIDIAADPVLLALEDADGDTFRATLDEVVNSAWELALTKRGSRIVQKAMEAGGAEDQKQILRQHHGHVLEALKSPHANHVLQKCIEMMPPDLLEFAMQEMQGEATFAARHRFGCRILQRLIEHGHPSQTEDLISELLGDSARLCRHQYGNFVIQHILVHGMSAHRSAIAKMLCEDTVRLAKHRIASHVLSCAIAHCAAKDVQTLTGVVLQDAGQLADLSRRQYGSFVVREVNRAVRMLDA